MLAWLAEKNVNYPANYYPTDLDVNGNFVVFQGLLGGDMTVDQAASDVSDRDREVAQTAPAGSSRTTRTGRQAASDRTISAGGSEAGPPAPGACFT